MQNLSIIQKKWWFIIKRQILHQDNVLKFILELSINVCQNTSNEKKVDDMLKKINVVVFDFDGTLSWPDSNFAFARYCMKHSIRPWLYLPMVGICGIIRLVNPDGIWWREKIRSFISFIIFSFA